MTNPDDTKLAKEAAREYGLRDYLCRYEHEITKEELIRIRDLAVLEGRIRHGAMFGLGVLAIERATVETRFDNELNIQITRFEVCILSRADLNELLEAEYARGIKGLPREPLKEPS